MMVMIGIGGLVIGILGVCVALAAVRQKKGKYTQRLPWRTALRVLAQHIRQIAVAAAAVAFAAGVISAFFLPKAYVSSYTVYVRGTGDSGLEYTAILKSRDVLSAAAEQMQQDQVPLSVKALQKAITTKTEKNTGVVYVTLTCTDAYRSQAACEALFEATSAKMREVTGQDCVRMLEQAEVGVKKGPYVLVNILLGALCGAVLSSLWLLVGYRLDGTVKREEDIRIGLDLPVLGVVPAINSRKGGR